MATAPVCPGIRLLFWSLVFVCFLFVYSAVVCSMCNLGSNLGPLYWMLGVLTTGSPGKSRVSLNRLLPGFAPRWALCCEAPLCGTVTHIWLRKEELSSASGGWAGRERQISWLATAWVHIVLCLPVGRWKQVQAPYGNLVQALILRSAAGKISKGVLLFWILQGLETGMAVCIGQDEKCGFPHVVESLSFPNMIQGIMAIGNDHISIMEQYIYNKLRLLCN